MKIEKMLFIFSFSFSFFTVAKKCFWNPIHKIHLNRISKYFGMILTGTTHSSLYDTSTGIRSIHCTVRRLSSSTSDRQLFNIFSNIVLGINDMHVNLYTPMGDVYWKSMIPASYPSRRIINAGKYVQSGPPQNSVFEYRTCQDSAIGYIIIQTF